MRPFALFLLPPLFASSSLTLVHRFRTAGAAGCSFDAASSLLACANFWDGISPSMAAHSVLYHVAVNGSGLTLRPQQRFPGSGAHGADFFSAGGSHFLAIPSYYGCGSERGPAQPGCGSTAIYRREGARFVEHQRLPTAGPSQTTHLPLPGAAGGGGGGTTWLLTGENFDDKICFWELRDGLFEKRGACLHVPGAGAMAVAVEGRHGWAGPTLLVAASYHDRGWATQSRVFRFVAGGARGGRFEEVQRIDTVGAHGVALRHLGGELLLFFAEDRGPNGPLVNSSLLRWEGGRFVKVQGLPTDGAHGARLFSLGGVPHLFCANFGDRLGSPPRYAARSALWRAAGPRGEPPWTLAAEVPSQGATDVAILEGVGGFTFAVLSNEGDLGRRAHQVSVVYRVDPGPEKEGGEL